jgi:hypothetical protein
VRARPVDDGELEIDVEWCADNRPPHRTMLTRPARRRIDLNQLRRPILGPLPGDTNPREFPRAAAKQNLS